MRPDRTYADHARDAVCLRAVRGGDEALPDGPSLGLAGLDLPVATEVLAPSVNSAAASVLGAPVLVTELACELETARVDDWRIAIAKVLAAAGWQAGTSLDAHVDTITRPVWLRRPAEPAQPCTCDCGREHHPVEDEPTAIPGVDDVLEGCVTVQSRGRIKLPVNLLKLLGADRHGGGITATTVADLDAVLLVSAADYLRRLLPDLTAPAVTPNVSATDADVVDNVRALHPTG
jgi:hypothetical protein